MGFPGQDSWSGFLFPSQGDLPVPGIEPASPVHLLLAEDSLPLSHQDSWNIKKAEHRRADAFELWVLEKTLEGHLGYEEIQPVNQQS